jgi:hypothetical protein
MKAASARNYTNEVFVVLALDDSAIVVVHQDDADDAPSTPPVDISVWAPDLITLSIVEPGGPPDEIPDSKNIAQVSLLDSERFAASELAKVSDEVSERCLAFICNPALSLVEVVSATTLVTLVASGLALQVISGLAANAAKDIDKELYDLIQGLQ